MGSESSESDHENNIIEEEEEEYTAGEITGENEVNGEVDIEKEEELGEEENNNDNENENDDSNLSETKDNEVESDHENEESDHESIKEESDKEESDKEESDKEESDKEESDKEESEKEGEDSDLKVEEGEDLQIIERIHRKLRENNTISKDLDEDVDSLGKINFTSSYQIVPLGPPKTDKRPVIEKGKRDYYFSECTYEGNIVNDRNEGKGTFTFANGNRYEGFFKDGMFHGKGVIYFTSGSRYEGEWDMGREISGRYLFNDNLEYKDPKTWEYCSEGDRRLWTEVVSERNKENGTYTNRLEGIRPSLTNGKQIDHLKEKGVIRDIPNNTYDTGEGYYSLEDQMLYTYDGKIAEDQSGIMR
eukprot:CAMPEP_0117428112 /NCGR_PEP_ID=MMETSP0758-20121206/7897_1 /TAXON_ID=63605 /ORGANISM="Percolomonas cosmopolitus, Strain AE-1 (ATCC 50343)" /LENGTH=360 /DNA_ID=CAMNT_0005214297 /DNA_START=9 /DNA_END=1087 /DNA_ORIENTATION=+